MALPKPTLDNRTFAQLVSEGTSQINRLSPAWTNYNAADPGITLLELFSWLSEQNLYRTDRVTDEMTRAFLRLVDIEPHPAAVASTIVTISTSGAAGVLLPARIQLADLSGTPAFETRTPLTVSPAALVRVLAAGAPPVDVTAANAAPYDAAWPEGGSFLPFGTNPRPGATLYLGFNAALGPPGNSVSLYVWTTAPQRDAQTRAALMRECATRNAAARRSCSNGFSSPELDWRTNDEARTVWEYLSASGSWQPLPELDDQTRALTLSGFVRFTLPPDHVPGGPGPNWFLRNRLVCGAFSCTTRLDCIGVNAVAAENAVSVTEPELLGTSSGYAAERYATAASPVVPGSTKLTFTGAPRVGDWTEVLTWDLTGPHDRSYELESETGTITSGNGMRGAVFPAGAQVFLDYRTGGGASGNLPPLTLIALATSAWNAARVPGGSPAADTLAVVQPVAATGGAAAETLTAAEARAITALAAPTRAITLSDIVALATAVPGVEVARATAVPQMHPAVPCFPAAGNVTVIVVPNCPGPAPTPTPGFLRAVARYLEPRRPVTTELHVIAPTYVMITVAATLQTGANATLSILPSLAQAALDAFFNPLSGGPDRSGWPIGRSVYRTEVMAILASLPNVLNVTDLTLQADADAPLCGNVDICAGDLIRSGQHAIAINASTSATFLRSSKRECN